MLEKLVVATDLISLIDRQDQLMENSAPLSDVIFSNARSLMFIGLVAMLLIGIMLARRIVRSLRYPLAEAADVGVADHNLADFSTGAR